MSFELDWKTVRFDSMADAELVAGIMKHMIEGCVNTYVDVYGNDWYISYETLDGRYHDMSTAQWFPVQRQMAELLAPVEA